VTLPTTDPTAPALVVWDPAAYRRLAAGAGDDPAESRARAVATAADDARAGLTPAASPFTLWALLADLAPRAGDRGGRAQAALAACVAHVGTQASTGAGTGAAVLLAPDPETLLAQAALGQAPPQHAAWNAYLASLAADAAGALLAGPGGARRLAGPLAHVVERAAQQTADAEDELQDAVVAAYEAGARAWDPGLGVAERQAQVAADDAALAAAVSAGRATRAAALVATAKDRDASGAVFTDPAVLTLAARRVRAAFAPGVRVWAELVRAVVAERVVPGGRGWRGAVWGAQVAFAAGAGGVGRVVTGSDVLRAAAEAAGGDAVAAA
jgi:hypothetical protein